MWVNCEETVTNRKMVSISPQLFTDWDGVFDDLFGSEDPIQTVESAHDSSSGIVSDVVSGDYPSPKMSTFKGGDRDDPLSSTDSSFSHGRNSQSSWSSPSTKASRHHQNHVNQDCYNRSTKTMSPRSPMFPVNHVPYPSPIMYKSPHLDSRLDYITTDLNHMDLQDTDKLIMKSSKGKRRHFRLAPFDLLSDDVIVKIFSNLLTDSLCRCSRVCHRWYRLVWDPTLWTAIIVNDETVNIDKALRVLTKRLSYETPSVCVIVEKVNLNGCEKLTDRGLHIIAKRCPELRHFEVQGCSNITNSALCEVVSHCVNLEYLNVTGCPCITYISLSDSFLSPASPHHLRQVYLRHLDMTDCYALDDEGLQVISLHCTQLQFLYLRRCVRITDHGIQYVAHYCSSLRELSVSDCRRITDFGMRELSKLDLNLRYLSVAKCDKISDVGIKYIAKHCTKLRYLNVRGCEAVSDDSVELLARNCTRLKSLDVGKCDITDEGLQVLAENAPQLKRLSLKSCDAITDQGVMLVAYKCQSLQQLNIQDCHLTADAYRTVKKYCRKCIIEHTNPGFCI